MYERFFGLRERPFELTPNPQCLVLTPGHMEAVGNIEYAISSRKGISLLIGQAGSGKTTVIRATMERQPASVHCIHLQNLALTRTEFIEILAATFELSHEARRSKAVLLLELETLLRDRHRANESTALFVDEAQTLSSGLLEEFRLLVNIETNREKLLTVILAGQPQLVARLDDPALSQLKQRIALWCELPPLTLTETAAYIASRIQWAGGLPANVFTVEAVKLIHQASAGVPRVINVISDNALVTGSAVGQRPVSSQVVEDVCRDFRIGLPATAPPILSGVQHAPAVSGAPHAPAANGYSARSQTTPARSQVAATSDRTRARPSILTRLSRYFSSSPSSAR